MFKMDQSKIFPLICPAVDRVVSRVLRAIVSPVPLCLPNRRLPLCLPYLYHCVSLLPLCLPNLYQCVAHFASNSSNGGYSRWLYVLLTHKITVVIEVEPIGLIYSFAIRIIVAVIAILASLVRKRRYHSGPSLLTILIRRGSRKY